MADFTLPTIGSKVRVTLDWSDAYKGAAVNVRRVYTYEGLVIESESYDDPGTFRLWVPEDRYMQQKVIYPRWMSKFEVLENIEDLVMNSDKPMAVVLEEKLKPLNEVTHHLVKGSKGNNYTVTQHGDSLSCDCMAGQHGRRCKHVDEVRMRVSSQKG